MTSHALTEEQMAAVKEAASRLADHHDCTCELCGGEPASYAGGYAILRDLARTLLEPLEKERDELKYQLFEGEACRNGLYAQIGQLQKSLEAAAGHELASIVDRDAWRDRATSAEERLMRLQSRTPQPCCVHGSGEQCACPCHSLPPYPGSAAEKLAALIKCGEELAQLVDGRPKRIKG